MKISRRDFAIATLASPLAAAAAAQVPSGETPLQLRSDHDLNLPAWGPYTKKYYGISHLPEPSKGLRFDLAFVPGFFRRTALIPNVLWESGYHPWEASADLSYYSARFELEWKDRVYIDLSFTALDENTRLIGCDLVNQSESEQNLSLHFLASMQFPPPAFEVDLPAGAVWIDALDYQDLRFAAGRPTDNLVPDGLLRGEIAGAGFVGGHGIGQRFGAGTGDTAVFQIALKEAIPNPALLVRYRRTEASAGKFQIEGLSQAAVSFPQSQDFAIVTVPLANVAAGSHNLRLTSLGSASVELDGFVLAPANRAAAVAFHPRRDTYQPQMMAGPHAASLLLKYRDTGTHYGLAWDFDQSQIREFRCGDLDTVFRYTTHNHVSPVIQGPGEGHYTDVFLRPVTLAPRSSRTLWAIAASGPREQVTSTLAQFPARRDFTAIRDTARSKRAAAPSATGAQYTFSQERMAATTLASVVYPLYLRRKYIRHNTPGRWWDSFYTWDSGFIGLGLLEHDVPRAVDCLNTYTFAPGDPYAAYLQHGTPVPVQMYLFLEIWNRTQSTALLKYFYPRLRQMYLFLAGRAGSSTTRRLASQLLVTWDYFYNSGGWDDYPPQQYVHAQRLERTVACVSNTAHTLRSAKILRMAALALGIKEDIAIYESDIETWTNAIQRNAWNQESGYFGYVTHDDQGRANGILREPGGKSFNMGLDGVTPLIAGICTPQQVDRICQNLMSGEHLWTPIGITTVDQAAPYHRNDGYWNGAVWMPHQWFLWKALLDLGRVEEAGRIAHTALELWQKEVSTTYNCYEHFLTQSGRGAGWHQFTGLSCPVMSWFGAYYRPGRLTPGLDVWVKSSQFSTDLRSLRASIEIHSRAGSTALVTLQPDRTYRVRWNGAPAEFNVLQSGVLAIALPHPGAGARSLEIDSA